MNKRILAAALTAAMLVSVVTSCNNNNGGNNSSSTGGSSTTSSSQGGSSAAGGDSSASDGEVGSGLGFKLDPAGYPVMDEPHTVKVTGFCTTPEGVDAWETPNEIYFFSEMEKRTNIHLDWTTMTRDALIEKIPILFASDDLPDVFFKTSLSASTLARYGTDGMVVNVGPLLETYAPDLYTYCADRDLLKFMTYEDGIWGFPYMFDSEGIRMDKIFVNEKWLENVNMEMPTNWDEIEAVAKAFRDQDANGNGDPNDEVPLGVGSITDMFSWLYSKYDLMNRGTSMAGNFIDADPADPSGNTIRAFITADEMKDVLKDAKHFWDEKLLPSTLFDADYYNAIWSTNISQNWAGFHTAWATATGNYVDDYIALPNAPSEKWNNVLGYLSGFGSGVITKECEIPEAMVSWFNYLYTIDGAYEFFLGIEGESYIIDDQGHVQLTEKITNHPELEQEQAHLRYSFYSGGGNPALATDETFKGGETYITSLNGCDNFRPATEGLTIWEAFPLNSDQTERINNVKGDISAVYKEYTAAFITGTKDIDADWQEYLDKLNAAGLEEFLAAYQEAYDVISG